MTTTLLIILLLADIGLVLAFYFLNRRQEAHSGMLADLADERRMLGELREQVRYELEAAAARSSEVLSQVTTLAAEADAEVKGGREALSKELDQFVTEFKLRIEEPLKDIGRRQMAIEKTVRKADSHKTLLVKAVNRAEQLVAFFDRKVPYNEVLQELEDKKYSDARHLLTKGMTPAAVAQELGMKETEVRLVAGLANR